MVNAGDTSWILTATALVLFMTMPGLALFYAGLVRSKNILSVLMHCAAICCLASVTWLAVAYSLAFSGDGAYVGDLSKLFLAGVSRDAMSGSIPPKAAAAAMGHSLNTHLQVYQKNYHQKEVFDVFEKANSAIIEPN